MVCLKIEMKYKTNMSYLCKKYVVSPLQRSVITVWNSFLKGKVGRRHLLHRITTLGYTVFWQTMHNGCENFYLKAGVI